MRVFEVLPHVSIGPLRLGMTPAEVRQAATGHAVEQGWAFESISVHVSGYYEA
jgi:hypothetical protein